ncbi:MAG: hypothetical protein M1153_01970 [Patescibacteria group bacterium]|nr:hypothetical protein [Patescibacteria group bacterium]
MIIEPTEGCSLLELLGDLEVAGYELVDAFYQQRIDAKDPRGERTYHMVRFLFASREFAEPSKWFKSIRDKLLNELRTICENALWRTRCFLNPFYENGEEVVDQRFVSVNLEVRQPLFHPDGQPVTIWKRNEEGKRVGDAPVPLTSSHRLRMVGSCVKLM